MTHPRLYFSLHSFAILMLTATASFAWQPPAQPPAAGEPPAPPAAAEKPPAAPEKPVPITNPTVHAVLEGKPSTPPELVRAVDTLINFQHAAVGRQFVKKLLDDNLDEATLAALYRQFGTPTFARIGQQAELQPEGRQFAEAVMTAADKWARDPQRLGEAIAKLQDPAAEVRLRAIVDLRSGGSAAAQALIAVLADEGRQQEHAQVRTALIGLGSTAIKPTIGMLKAPEVATKIQACQVLAGLPAGEAVPFLLAPALAPQSPPELQAAAQAALQSLRGRVPNVASAEGTLYADARLLYDRVPLGDGPNDSPAETWIWDAAQRTVVPQELPRTAYNLQTAAILAADLYALSPNNPYARRLYLGTQLEAAAYAAGAGQPLPAGEGTPHDIAAAATIQELEDLLAQAMASNHLPAATAAASILGEKAKWEVLYRNGARPSVLVEAAMHPDRRLRMAAIDAAVKLHPPSPFPGSSQVLQGLGYFANSSGRPKALVIETRNLQARRLASYLVGMGYDADAVTDARQWLQMAAANPDYELALIEFSLAGENVSGLIQSLRREPRSATLPVGLVINADDTLAAERLARREPRVQVFIRPSDQAGMEFYVAGLRTTTAAGQVPADERLAQAKLALAHLAKLAEKPQGVYDLQRVTAEVEAALFVPELCPLAAPLAADLGTASGQRALVRLASQAGQLLEMRQAAAAAFRRAVARYGILLTSPEIVRQFDRYNQSENEPEESQQVLAAVLDAIESRTQPESVPAPQ